MPSLNSFFFKRERDKFQMNTLSIRLKQLFSRQINHFLLNEEKEILLGEEANKPSHIFYDINLSLDGGT